MPSNIFDAAEIYPIPPKPETQGRTEAIIGTWLAARKTRDKVVIATKVAGRGKMVWVRKNETATRQSPGVMSFLKAAEQQGLPRPASIQNAYNLVNRSFEIGLSEVAYREHVGVLAYSPLGQGYLSGKYEGGALPPGSRKALFARLGRYEKWNGPVAISAYIEVARRHGLDPAQMAISFAASRPFVTSTIIGATTMSQLKTDIAAADLKLSDAVLADIEQVHLDYPNPCP
jgi:aryl-alcohol dehydrogenase-like predicted oxidoreductase